MPQSHNRSDSHQRGDGSRTQHAFEQSRDTARRAAASLESNPLGIVIGGLAVGAVAAVLIPRSQRERELLAPVGKRLNETALAAFAAAKESGAAELEARGLTRDGARDQVRNLFEGLTRAASSAGAAAVDTARGKTA